MTNVRKRRLYPIISGRRKPKTKFDHNLLAEHNRKRTSKHSNSIFTHYTPNPYETDSPESGSSEPNSTRSTADSTTSQDPPKHYHDVDSDSEQLGPDELWQSEGISYPSMQILQNTDNGSPDTFKGVPLTPFDVAYTGRYCNLFF